MVLFLDKLVKYEGDLKKPQNVILLLSVQTYKLSYMTDAKTVKMMAKTWIISWFGATTQLSDLKRQKIVDSKVNRCISIFVNVKFSCNYVISLLSRFSTNKMIRILT